MRKISFVCYGNVIAVKRKSFATRTLAREREGGRKKANDISHHQIPTNSHSCHFPHHHYIMYHRGGGEKLFPPLFFTAHSFILSCNILLFCEILCVHTLTHFFYAFYEFRARRFIIFSRCSQRK